MRDRARAAVRGALQPAVGVAAADGRGGRAAGASVAVCAVPVRGHRRLLQLARHPRDHRGRPEGGLQLPDGAGGVDRLRGQAVSWNGQRRATPFTFKAVEFLDGAKIVWAEPPDDRQTYQQEYARTLAMKRVGSARGDISGVTGGDQRKTATEVKALMATSNGMSVDAVDRFAEPWAELFGMMWQHLSRAVRGAGGKCGLTVKPGEALPAEAWGASYCVAAGVSGRAVTQTQTLAALTNMGQLAALMENMTQTLGPAAVKDFYLWIFQILDSDLSRRVMAASKGAGAGPGAGAGAAPGTEPGGAA